MKRLLKRLIFVIGAIVLSSSLAIAAAPTITPTSLQVGTVGTFFSKSLAATGGTAPLTWDMQIGRLPLGLSLNPSTGVISGTPTEVGCGTGLGKSCAIVRVTDAMGLFTNVETVDLLHINDVIAITTSALPKGMVNRSYSQTVSIARSGNYPLTWSVTSGALPDGLSFNAQTREITGFPTTSGVSNFTLQVTDSFGVTASKALSISIAPLLVITTITTLPGGAVGSPYLQTVAAIGGTAPYAWSFSPWTVTGLPTGLTLNSNTGVISGTPITANVRSVFSLTVTDSVGELTYSEFSITVAAVVSITTNVLPTGTVGTPYFQTIATTGGTAPVTFSLTSGTLPAGLSLNTNTGVITGTPTAAGTISFNFQVSDGDGVKASRALSITITPTLTITTTSVQSGTTNSPFARTITATGGTLPYFWSLTAGSLPTGITLNSATGLISGAPQVETNSFIIVQVADSLGATFSQPILITIVSGPAIGTTSLPQGAVGVAYSQTIAATGGTAPLTFSLTSGTLPPGLILNATTGAITGTPTTAGSSSFSVRVIDSLGAPATKALSITIAAAPTITTASFAVGTVGFAYSQTAAANGGTAGYTWTVTVGSLPAGLALIAGTGTISGTPTTAGTLNFTLRVTDSLGAIDTKAFSIGIFTAPAQISVSKTGTGSGTITTNPAGITCGPTCSTSSYTSGQVVTLTATPAAGSIFSGWSGDADCIDGSVAVSGTTSCTARFDLPQSSSMQVRGDFDGDGKTDVAVYRPPTGEWFIRLSTKGYSAAASAYFQWGLPGDIPIVGDFDGDQKAEIAVYRPSTGEWFMRLSTQGYSAATNGYFLWGAAGDVPVPGDFDGDRKTDIAVYRPSLGQWFIRLSTLGFSSTANAYFPWGAIGDVPVPGDFDGDLKTDIAVYRPSTEEWFIRLSTQGYSAAASSYFLWGGAGNVPVPGDFDGDSKADIAKYRPSTGEWFIRLSTLGYSDTTIGYFQWGAPNDRPILADFDGDGKTEATIYRPSTGEWFIRFSSQGYSTVTNGYLQWGFGDDLPLPR